MGRSMQELLIFNAFLTHTSDSIVIKEYFATDAGNFVGNTRQFHYQVGQQFEQQQVEDQQKEAKDQGDPP